MDEYFFHDVITPSGPEPLHYQCFTNTLRRTTLGMIPLDEWSGRRRDLYLKTHNNHKRKTSLSLAGFKTAIPASERPQTHALDRAAAKIGLDVNTVRKYFFPQSKPAGTVFIGQSVLLFPYQVSGAYSLHSSRYLHTTIPLANNKKESDIGNSSGRN